MRFLVSIVLIISCQSYASILAPELSDRTYRYIELDNSLKVLLIADPTTNRAAAALDVFVGSNNDPIEYPGLAHLLEHMLFLGTDKFPKPGEYQDFISKNNGVYNAYTEPEHTNYFFGVNPLAFESALDRFSRFFVAPTLDPEYVDREINAIHSEYQSKLKDESRRSFEAIKSGLNPVHPITRFSAGNFQTLNKDGLTEALTKFYQTQYSANRMTLVVIANRTLDELEKMVSHHFSRVINRDLKPAYTPKPLFDLNRLPYVIKSKPVTESRKIALYWPIPKTDAFVSKAPLTYIGHLLGHEGPTSLLNRFKQLGWATGLQAGRSIAMTSSQSMSVNVSLTPEGYKNRQQIIADILSAIRRLELDGLEEWRFKELKTVNEAFFQFAEESDPISTVTGLANRLHTTPPQEIFTRGNFFSSFDELIIRDILTWLTPETMLINIVAPEINANETTPYYLTEMRQYVLPANQLSRFIEARKTPLKSIEWPLPNPFVRDPGKPLKVTRKTTSDTQPQVVLSTPGVWAYVLPENRFSQPRSDLYVSLRTPLASDSPESALMADLLARAINENFNFLNYDAMLAGAGFRARATQSGITLEFSGFHRPILPLIDNVIKGIQIPLIDEPTWNLLYQAKKQKLSEANSTRPFSRLFDEIKAGLMPLAFTQADLAKTFGSITRTLFHDYQKAFFAGFHVELFLHGPVSPEEGGRLLKLIIDQLPIDTHSKTIEITTKPWDLEKVETFIFPHPDQAAVVAYVSDDKSSRGRILNQFAGSLLEAPFYTTLRTQKQLGYLTFATAFSIFNTPILAGVIQSPVASPDELTAAITKLITSFPEQVAKISNDTYNQSRHAMIDDLLNPPLTQAEMSSAIWNAIATRRPFNDRMVQAGVLDNLTRDEFINYLQNHLKDPVILKAYNAN